MYLTEEIIKSREETFIEMVELLANEMYDKIDEDYEMTNEDWEVANIMMEHFVENYNQPTLKESAAYSLMGGYNPNQELFEEYIELVLDESIGGAVAGAVYGIKNLLTGRKAKSTESKFYTASKASQLAHEKARTAQRAVGKSTGISGAFKQGKADVLAKRKEKAMGKMDVAYQKSQAAATSHKTGVEAREKLKQKIDTGVSNVKSKVKSAAERVAGAAGRFIGRFS